MLFGSCPCEMKFCNLHMNACLFLHWSYTKEAPRFAVEISNQASIVDSVECYLCSFVAALWRTIHFQTRGYDQRYAQRLRSSTTVQGTSAVSCIEFEPARGYPSSARLVPSLPKHGAARALRVFIQYHCDFLCVPLAALGIALCCVRWKKHGWNRTGVA